MGATQACLHGRANVAAHLAGSHTDTATKSGRERIVVKSSTDVHPYKSVAALQTTR